MIPPRRAAVRLLVFVALMTGGTSVAAAGGPPKWGEIRLIGGVPAARAVFNLGEAEGRFDATWFLDFVHRYTVVGNWPADVIETFDRYQRTLATIRRAAVQWPDGVRLAAPGAPRKDVDAIKEFLDLLGINTRESRGQLSTSLDDSKSAKERATWLKAAGVDTAAVVARLNAGETVPIVIDDGRLPLPLPAFFTESVFEPDRDPILTLVHDREAALLYLGLMSLDDETLEFLADRPRMVKRLRDAAPVLAGFGRGIRIRNGAVDLPGGPDTAPLWRALVGKPASDPEGFIDELLTRDDGRLAYFYDAIDRLDAQHQAFALAKDMPAKQQQLTRTVYGFFAGADPTWNVKLRPFHRPIPDPGFLLDTIDVVPGGVAGPEWLPTLLYEATRSSNWPSNPDRVLKSVKTARANAAWILGWLFERFAEREDRARTLLFVQRMFPDADRSTAPSIDAAVRACLEMPSLARSLERMGVSDPAVFARVARGAHTLSAPGDAKDVLADLERWQSALALLEQIHRRRHLAPAEINPLLVSLGDIGIARKATVSDAVTLWITDRLLPMFVPAGTPTAAAEAIAVRAFVTSASAPAEPFSWEGLTYVRDLHGPIVRDVQALRTLSPTPTVGDLLALADIRRRLEAGVGSVPDAAQLSRDLDGLRAAIRAIPAAATAPDELVRELEDAIKELRKITLPADLKKAAQQLPAVRALLVATADVVVPPTVFALAAAPLAQPPAVYAEAWMHATIAPPAGQTQLWRRWAWEPAMTEPRTGGGTLLRGSMLAIDVPLAEAHMPRFLESGLSATNANIADSATLMSELALVTPAATDPSEESAAIAALARGREAVASWARTPPAHEAVIDVLRQASIGPERTNVIAWLVDRQPASVPAGLTLLELARIGAGVRATAGLDTPAMPIDGCLCLVSMGVRAPETYRSYWNVGVVAALSRDLRLRLIEHLSTNHLPLALVDDLLPPATADWFQHIAPFGPDDWEALTLWPKQLGAQRLDEYLLALIKAGRITAPGKQ